MMIALLAATLAWVSGAAPGPTDDDGVFLLFGRDDGRPAVWRYAPGEPKPTLARCGTLPQSPWTPTRQFVRAPEYVRLQVPDPTGENRYRVILYRVDPKSGALSTVLRAPMILPWGGTDKTLYVQTAEGIHKIDRATGKASDPEAPFWRVGAFGDVWLVRPGRVNTGDAYLFDVDSGHVGTTPVRLPDFGANNDRPAGPSPHMALHPKRTHLACVEPVAMDAVRAGRPRTVDSALHIIDLSTGSTRRVPIRITAAAGSGVRVVYPNFDVWFDRDGRLHCFAASENAAAPTSDAPTATDRVTIDPATGEITRQRATPESIRRRVDKRRTPTFVPAFLEPKPKTALDLLATFLERHERPHQIRVDHGTHTSYRHAPHAFTRDGKRFVAAVSTADKTTLYVGDLGRDTLRAIAEKVDVRSVGWVSTPGE